MVQVQVKRKRDQDPLQALVVRTKRKRLDPMVFRLAGTYDQADARASDLVLDSSAERSYKLPRSVKSRLGTQPSTQLGNQLNTDVETQSATGSTAAAAEAQSEKHTMSDIPLQLQSMINDYINEEKASSSVTNPAASVKLSDLDAETEDYVYDVYYSDPRAAPAADAHIGYLDLDEDQLPLIADDGDSSDDNVAEGDDDSNAEDFYRNDYPEDEDDEGLYELSDLEDELGDLKISQDEWSEASDY